MQMDAVWCSGVVFVIVIPAWRGEWVRSSLLWLQYITCSACLLSNTCFFFLGHRAKRKKECVQGGWEKCEVYARHVARISVALELGQSCQIEGTINWQRKKCWISLFCLCWALKGSDPNEESWGPRSMLTVLVCHPAWFSHHGSVQLLQ